MRLYSEQTGQIFPGIASGTSLKIQTVAAYTFNNGSLLSPPT